MSVLRQRALDPQRATYRAGVGAAVQVVAEQPQLEPAFGAGAGGVTGAHPQGERQVLHFVARLEAHLRYVSRLTAGG